MRGITCADLTLTAGLMHFICAFSRGFFDEKAGCPDLERLRGAGEAFGGRGAAPPAGLMRR